MPEKLNIEEINNKKDRLQIAELLAERASWTKARKEAESMERACTETLVPLLERLDIASIRADDDKGIRKLFVMAHGMTSVVSKTKLIEKGIDPGLIEECTSHSSFVSITMRDIKVEGKYAGQ